MITRDLLRAIVDGYSLSLNGVHGISHWGRVLENGRRLSVGTHADARVIELFAVFHDARRFVDGIDPGHGRRGADLARSLRGRVFDLDDTAFELLTEACETHTDGLREGDFTVRVCWDADRLDLGRCLIAPDPERLATPAARDPRILAWADERAHDQHVPSLVRDIWRPLLDGDGDGR